MALLATFYHGNNCHYLTLLHSKMPLLDSTFTLYYTLLWLYTTLLHSTLALLDSTPNENHHRPNNSCNCCMCSAFVNEDRPERAYALTPQRSPIVYSSESLPTMKRQLYSLEYEIFVYKLKKRRIIWSASVRK